MKISLKRYTHIFKSAAVLFASLSVLGGLAQAQDYPNKSISLIVGFPPGGSNDIVARLFAPKLTEILGQSVVVVNKSGSNGLIGTDFVAKAAPDGYTITIASASPLVISPHTFPKISFNTLTDLVGITTVAQTPELLALHPSVPAKSLKELIDLSKTRRVTISSSGSGGLPHLAIELLRTAAGSGDIIHVPYKGTAPALTALIAGHVSSSIQPLINAAPNAKSGRIRLLALTGAERSPVVPEVPTMMESGLPQFNVVAWYGVHAPSGTPKSAIDKINAEMTRTLNLVEIKEQLNRGGLDPSPNSPDQFAKFVEAEVVRWKKVIADAGIKGD